VSSLAHPPRAAVVEAVTRALAEDLTPLGDLTSTLLPDDLVAEAAFVVRDDGVLAGTACAAETFAQVDPSIGLAWHADDGDAVAAGTTVAVARGRLAPILTAERTALNFLGHLSGIATHTRAFVDAAAVGGGRARIWDTRKTTPGLRSLERQAVRDGGGRNHRRSLSDAVMAKDNHLAVLTAGGQDLTAALRAARERMPHTAHLEVEVDRLDQVDAVLAGGADTIMLDNFSLDDLRTGVARIARRAVVEASGGVSLETVGAIAATGVDVISVGALTHSARALDLGLDVVIEPAPASGSST
jgi:nicotinate-nucleotide pyrophosphorylase (carboxylating)